MGNKRKPYAGVKLLKRWRNISRYLNQKKKLSKLNEGDEKTLKPVTLAPSIESNDVSEVDVLIPPRVPEQNGLDRRTDSQQSDTLMSVEIERTHIECPKQLFLPEHTTEIDKSIVDSNPSSDSVKIKVCKTLKCSFNVTASVERLYCMSCMTDL
ncbi:hypothetical protein O3G_MSEX000339 [Manduca sexta]|nr:hypothetical protein O3G_MSEX000339 [Manduca sexta]